MPGNESAARAVAGGPGAFRIPHGRDSILITNPVNVRYLTGFTGSAGCVLRTRNRKLFFTDFRYQKQAERQVRHHDVRIVTGTPALAAAGYAVRRRMKLGVLGVENASMSQLLHSQLKRVLKGVRLRDSSGAVEALRLIKDEGELDRIREAAAIADGALQRLVRNRVIGRREDEIAWMLERWMREAGSGRLPFEIIVASGPRSAMPHGVASDKVIGRDELVVIDLGARIDGYCSDITRTFTTGALTVRQQRIYEVVRGAQEKAMAAVAKGAACAGIDGTARSVIEKAGYGDDFGHALGHGVGLEAHEGPVLAARSKERLSAGMVVTVEPGIYRERVGGVRIEDTVAVTESGAERITRFSRELISLH